MSLCQRDGAGETSVHSEPKHKGHQDQGWCETDSGGSWPPAPPPLLSESSPWGLRLTGPEREHPPNPPGASRPLTREHLSLLRDPNQGQRGAEVTPGVELDSVNIRTVSLKRLSVKIREVKRDIRYSKKRSYPSFDSLITPLKYPSDLSIALISLLA